MTRRDPSATLSLRSVTVRPIRGLEERRRWDALMAAHHYLSYRGLVRPTAGLFGRALRQVAEWGGEWVALLGWQAGVLKLSARDRWIGWLPTQQYRRLHLIANNTRFLILPGATGSESGLAGAGAEPAPAVERLASLARASGLVGRDFRRSVALCRHLLPGGELALGRLHRGLCTASRTGAAMGLPQST